MRHDVIIIGGGSAGYAAARTASEAGTDVAIVDHGPLAGLCILRGCMPSKAILRSAEVMALSRRASEFGFQISNPSADLGAIIARKNRLIREFADDRIGQLRDSRFTLYEEAAHFISAHEVQVGDQIVIADRIIIATGSVVSHIAIPGLEDAGYITSDEALELNEQPETMLVLGGGSVAVELAQFFARIGTQVTLIQRSDHILSTTDEDLARPVEASFREEGISVFTGTRLHRVSAEGKLKVAHFSQGDQERTATGEVILQAMGRRPNIDGLSLEAAGVNVDNGTVRIDAQMRTNLPHIFAVGDVNGLHEIVHIAIEQGEIAGYNASRAEATPKEYDDRLKAQVVFTDPQVASVGLTEKECQSTNASYLAASYPFDNHGKSLCLGETSGHAKLLCEPGSGRLLGAHLVGPEAGELIHELIAVMYFDGTVRDILQIPHYHPTLAEIITYPAEELIVRLGR